MTFHRAAVAVKSNWQRSVCVMSTHSVCEVEGEGEGECVPKVRNSKSWSSLTQLCSTEKKERSLIKILLFRRSSLVLFFPLHCVSRKLCECLLDCSESHCQPWIFSLLAAELRFVQISGRSSYLGVPNLSRQEILVLLLHLGLHYYWQSWRRASLLP
jgi:hypothetical protein